jgi:hypothetical protein
MGNIHIFSKKKISDLKLKIILKLSKIGIGLHKIFRVMLKLN